MQNLSNFLANTWLLVHSMQIHSLHMHRWAFFISISQFSICLCICCTLNGLHHMMLLKQSFKFVSSIVIVDSNTLGISGGNTSHTSAGKYHFSFWFFSVQFNFLMLLSTMLCFSSVSLFNLGNVPFTSTWIRQVRFKCA